MGTFVIEDLNHFWLSKFSIADNLALIRDFTQKTPRDILVSVDKGPLLNLLHKYILAWSIFPWSGPISYRRPMELVICWSLGGLSHLFKSYISLDIIWEKLPNINLNGGLYIS